MMTGHSNDYDRAASKYRPSAIHVLFIAESPPAYTNESEKSYFFFENNPGPDGLFSVVMEALFRAGYRKRTGNKPELLRRFQNEGYWLVDAVEYPINKINGKRTSDRLRARIIHDNLPVLFRRLEAMERGGFDREKSGIILIKKVVFEVLSPELCRRGYNLLHGGKIDFPKWYHDPGTIAGIREALRTKKSGSAR